jgi:hypothetical protein
MATTDAHSPYHIRDNNFGSNTGTVWATSNADMYEYDDAAESHDMYDTAYNNMCTLNIDSRHAASCPVDGFLDVTTQLPNLTTCQNHGLLGDNTCGATMDIASRSHSATAADVSWCTISGRATRNAVWDFMLTN